MRLTNRRGIFIGLVLAILVVFAILSAFIMTSGTSEYNQTVLVAYRLKADAYAQAVMEEALAVVYDKVNRPDDGNVEDDIDNGRDQPPWKIDLFEKIVAADSGGSTEIGVLAEYDLYEMGLLPESLALIEGDEYGQGEIEECTVQFEGFRKLRYTPNGFYINNRDKVYYKCPLETLDPADLEYPYPNDYQGYFVIKIKISYGSGRTRIEKHLATVHDVKVVNQTPSARRFAVFQYYPVADTATRDDDLNQGGGLKIMPNDKARLFIRGPYISDTYGRKNGTGDKDNDDNFAPDNKLSYWNGNDYHGWGLIPSPRAGIRERAFIFWGLAPSRPYKPEGKTIIGLINPLGAFNKWINPGYTLLDDQFWFCASKDQSDENVNRAFSLFGDSGDIQTFEGIYCKVEDDGNETNIARHLGGSWPGGLGDDSIQWLANEKLEERWVKRAEGGIIQRVNLAKFNTWKLKIVLTPYQQYDVKIDGQSAYPYGAYYMPNAEAGLVGALVGLVVDVVIAIATIYTCGAAAGAAGAAMAITKTLAMSALSSTGAAMSLGALAHRFEGSGSYNMNPDPGDFLGFFPSNHRKYLMTTTRWYYSLDELRTWSEDPNEFPLVLDGSVFVKDMGEQHWFQYFGKGMIMSENIAGQAQYANPSIEGPIKAMVSPNIDHLNLIYLSNQETAAQGTDMLYVRAVPSGEVTNENVEVTDNETFIDGSVYSVQGVAPDVEEPPDRVTIGGNYLCGYFNKRKIPEDSQLHVNYNVNYYPDDEDIINSFHDGRWHNISVSFRPSGWYDRRRIDD